MNLDEKCCDAWGLARQEGTDNEGYGSLIIDNRPGYGWGIGCDLPRVLYCPWCGATK